MIGFVGEVPVLLAKPQTYMNLSGESVSIPTYLPTSKTQYFLLYLILNSEIFLCLC